MAHNKPVKAARPDYAYTGFRIAIGQDARVWVDSIPSEDGLGVGLVQLCIEPTPGEVAYRHLLTPSEAATVGHRLMKAAELP
ncbi:hypothetical protein [Kitasatospora purpeofusca]|uniref:hypothetical protein n=1 Tax=Kitasatospora purpeofusca TaxID=67352 RepID=UPI00369F99F9